MHSLLKLCRTKCVQLVISTHSPHVLEELPPEARMLLVRVPETRVVYGASSQFCLTTLDDRQHPELTVFVEDPEAAALVRELVFAWERERNEALLSRIAIVSVGASSVVATLDQLANSNRLPYPAVAISDADQDRSASLKLPGSQAPERQVFEDLKREQWADIPERFGSGPASAIGILEDAMLDPNHHKWTERIGDKLRMSRITVWDILAAAWVRRCVTLQQRDNFIQGLLDRIARANVG